MPDAQEIVRRHGAMVWRTICRIVGESGRTGDLEDCFQEVFVAALEAGRREEVRSWEAFLRRIATARALDLLRTRIRRRGREAAVAWDDLPSRTESAPEAALRAELAEEIREALAQLRPEEAELFCLRHIEDMSYDDMGMQLGISAGAVGVALHRVKEKLRVMLTAGKVSSQGEVRDE
jgi:RNA polymerase sigma-70 factor (ECF subfamily)